MMGETVAQTVCDNRISYRPGVWFNSAKFFDIEYQTYGWVWANTKEGESTLYWEDTEGEKCLKLVYDTQSLALLGVNVFGIRLRHKVLDQWISSALNVEEAIQRIREANFDPEFFKDHFDEIKTVLQAQLINTTA